MMDKILALSLSALLAASAASAQQAAAIDCSLAANAANPACVTLPPAGDVQNFLPLLPAVAGAAIAAAVAGGGGGGDSTPSTN